MREFIYGLPLLSMSLSVQPHATANTWKDLLSWVEGSVGNRCAVWEEHLFKHHGLLKITERSTW